MVRSWSDLVRKFGFFILIASIFLAACGAASESVSYAPAGEGKGMEQPAPPAAAPMAPMEEAVTGSIQDSSAPAQIDRLVIKNANMTIVVPDPALSMDRISQLAEEMGGFVVSANLYKQTLSNGTEVPRVSIAIRVPAEKLDQALESIRSESDETPQSESLNSQDVTSEYVDLESRLKNLEAAEAELTEIMQDARKTEDVLSVYNQLVSIREQIEVIKGQMKYYEQSAALSSISVELIADQAVQPIEIGGWKPVGIAKDAIESLLKALQSLISAVIWILLFLLPVLLVLFLIFVLPPLLIFRAWKRRRNQKKMQAQPPVQDS